MKVLYATFLNEDIRPGYKIKIHSQCRAFYYLEYQSYLLIVKKYGFCLYSIGQDEKILKKIQNQRTRKSNERNIKDEFFLFQQFSDVLMEVVRELQPEVIYIRRVVPTTPWLIKSLKFIKKQEIRIIYEYPTYPWKMEMVKGRHFFLLMIDLIFYHFVEKTVDVIGYMGEYNGRNRKYVSIYNGVDINAFKKHQKKEHGSINLIGVAHVAYYHGYDRVIYGLADYYAKAPKERVEFHIVGSIDEKLGLQRLVDKLHVEEYVKFYGLKMGRELDDIFNMCDIGVDALALFRRGKNTLTASLKGREYLARGVPTLMSGRNTFDDTDIDFIFHISPDETPVVIEKLVSDFRRMNSNVDDIRRFAEKNLSWEQTIKKVVELKV